MATRKGRIFVGCAINAASARLAELAARVGFDLIWIEMEHASADLRTAEALCVAAECGGAIPMVRTAGIRRDQILPALEIGGRFIVVPLVNDAETAREVVKHGKFRPMGQRGYNTRSRAAGYSAAPFDPKRMNAEVKLLPQIESVQAVESVDRIIAVPGIDGVFIGPGDLSADLGRPGDMENGELRDMVCACIRKARLTGLHAGIFVGEGALLDAAVAAGADLCVIASDFGAVIEVWKSQIERLSGSVGTKSGRSR